MNSIIAMIQAAITLLIATAGPNVDIVAKQNALNYASQVIQTASTYLATNPTNPTYPTPPVNPVNEISVTSPYSGQRLVLGRNHTVSWSYSSDLRNRIIAGRINSISVDVKDSNGNVAGFITRKDAPPTSYGYDTASLLNFTSLNWDPSQTSCPPGGSCQSTYYNNYQLVPGRQYQIRVCGGDFQSFYATCANSSFFYVENTDSTYNNNDTTVNYRNSSYGIEISLPSSWRGYTIRESEWTATRNNSSYTERGPLLRITPPSSSGIYQELPVMVIAREQWNMNLIYGAAPIGPNEMGRNSRYVFAIPARYNYAFPTGYEEVDRIISQSYRWRFFEPDSYNSGDIFSQEFLRNQRYNDSEGYMVRLSNGAYDYSGANGRYGYIRFVDNYTAVRDITGDGQRDAVVILKENTGGTGVFYYVHALINDNGVLNDSAQAYLGDRINLESVTIDASGLITARMYDRIVTYRYQNGRLVQQSSVWR